MNIKKPTYSFLLTIILLLLPLSAKAQNDSIVVDTITKPIAAADAARISGEQVEQNTTPQKWVPDAKKAMWMSIVIPGGGQIYNRKFWKLPIFYGGFVGCAFAYSWNNQMYKDYKQAYLDITDGDTTTDTYNKFMHFGNTINEGDSRYTELFRKRKDTFLRFRDLSFFCFVGVYALSIIDAYVDASLSEFDISDNLSLQIQPGYINNSTSRNPLSNGGWGLQCNLNF